MNGRKIHAYIRGRLGNQLFQYAFVRMLQHKNPSVQAVYHFDEVYSAGSAEQGFVNGLKEFRTVGVEETGEPVTLTLSQRLMLKSYWNRYPHTAPVDMRTKYQMQWVKLLNLFGLYYLDLGYYPFEMSLNSISRRILARDVIVSGNFESERYFRPIREQILKEVEFRNPLSASGLWMTELMRQTDSVALSIRRGDFVDNPDVSQLHNVCSASYYDRAVDYIRQCVSHPVLFVFSNDIEWAKKHVDYGIQTYYEPEKWSPGETLEVMSHCKHFIISNSTFHWWAQYKSTNPDKIVVAPERWFNSPFVPDIFLDYWKKLPV